MSENPHPLYDLSNVWELPYVEPSECRNLPPSPGLYFVANSPRGLLYIGRTINLKTRWSVHERKKQVRETLGAKIFYHSCEESELELEDSLIRHHRPVWNGIGTPREIPPTEPESQGHHIDVALENFKIALYRFIEALRSGNESGQKMADILLIVGMAGVCQRFCDDLHTILLHPEIGVVRTISGSYVQEEKELSIVNKSLELLFREQDR